MLKKHVSMSVVAAALACTGLTAAKQAGFDPSTAPLDAALPADPAVLTGALPNGMRYFIRANGRPAQRAELRLVVNAGSLVEDDDQRGAAHFVEHMAFRGTEHFPGTSLVSFLSVIGTNLGRDLNGSTDFHQTIYKLQAPTDTRAVMDRCLSVLDDWSRAIAFAPDAFERERAILIEEWRTRQTAASRAANHGYEVLLAGSRYPDRMPAGTEDSLKALTLARVKQFYTDWYRPEQMAVVAVGDFDPAVVQTLIQQRFTSAAASTPGRPHVTFAVPARSATTFDVRTDPEAPVQTISVTTVRPARTAGLVDSVRAAVADGIIASALVARLSDRARAADPPFISATATRARTINRLNDASSLGALVNNGAFERALDTLVTEGRRMAAFGLSEAELSEQRAALTRAIDRETAESTTRVSAAYADDYARTAGLGLPIADTAAVDALRRRFLSTLSRADLDAAAKEWFSGGPRFVMAIDREAPGVPELSDARLRAVLAASDARPITPPVDRAPISPLMTAFPTPGRIVEASTVAPPGATVWTLSNGAHVVLLPTADKADEVQFFATAPGGKSLAPDAEAGVASAASLAATAAGLGDLTTAELARVLRGRTAVATPSVADYATRLRGAGSRQDLETLFQVIHLRFNLSRADPALFESGKRTTGALLSTVTATPEGRFADAMSRALGRDSVRARPPTPAEVESWTLNEAVAFYRARFADAGNFTFGFVGSFDVETMRPLVERYLASLPALPAHETWKDTGLRTPEGVVERTIRAGTEPKARVAIVFNGPFSYSAHDRASMAALQSVVQSRLFGAIRNQLGGTYTITAASQMTGVPVGSYRFTVQWECDPQRVDELVQRVFAELDVVKSTPVSPAGLSAWRESIERNQASAGNAVRVAQLLEAYENGGGAGDPWRVTEAVRTVTTADIMTAARTYLDTGRYVKVVMLPADTPIAGQ